MRGNTTKNEKLLLYIIFNFLKEKIREAWVGKREERRRKTAPGGCSRSRENKAAPHLRIPPKGKNLKIVLFFLPGRTNFDHRPRERGEHR